MHTKNASARNIEIEITSGDDDSDPDPIKHHPTPSEALRAISLLTDYTDTVNDPIAHKLEGLLNTFSHQICLEQFRGMKETVITDYFHPIHRT
ncbi:hypothetical protein BC826DRAFT_924275 [Russula brevipes]|nr:hypothetical protein BC826DRAFT_924275 [Russula brevipes]